MPRPCAVEPHARRYKEKAAELSGDATALRRGASRSLLQNTSERVLRMPRPCAVEAHARRYKERVAELSRDATALRRGASRSLLERKRRGTLWGMPRPCAVEPH